MINYDNDVIEIDGGFELILLVTCVGISHSVQLPPRAFLYVQFNAPILFTCQHIQENDEMVA